MNEISYDEFVSMVLLDADVPETSAHGRLMKAAPALLAACQQLATKYASFAVVTQQDVNILNAAIATIEGGR